MESKADAGEVETQCAIEFEIVIEVEVKSKADSEGISRG